MTLNNTPVAPQLRLKRGRVGLWRAGRDLEVTVGNEKVFTTPDPEAALARFDFENAQQWRAS